MSSNRRRSGRKGRTMLHLVRLSIGKFRGFATKGRRSVVYPRVQGYFSRAMIYSVTGRPPLRDIGVCAAWCAREFPHTWRESPFTRLSKYIYKRCTRCTKFLNCCPRSRLGNWFPVFVPRHLPFLRAFHCRFEPIFFVKCKYIDETVNGRTWCLSVTTTN